MKKLTKSEFIERANLVHKNKYDYSKVEYKNIDSSVEIICPIHGTFNKRAYNHLVGFGCNKCSPKQNKNLDRYQKITDNFVKKANLIHLNKYDYSKVKYINARSKVIIICPIHGEFEQTIDNHLHGHKCMKCSIIENNSYKPDTKDQFIEKAKLVHGDVYDYSKIDYYRSKSKIKIICKKHGIFSQKACNHLSGRGCPACVDLTNSKGQRYTEDFLKNNKIAYKRQYTFTDCRNPETNRLLFFDFYLYNLNICIEYDGQQHFKPRDKWGGVKGLMDTQKRDKIKDDYCLSKGILLIRISYKDNIIDKLKFLIT